jgi:small subunit ribosomal protein S4
MAMSRFTGPRLKKIRALGMNLPGLTRKSFDRRPYPPGEHAHGRRRKQSDYGRQLTEKQKLRLNYGISERQLRGLFKAARRSKVSTGEKLLELLERRLDNCVFRAGFAPTIPAARQLVNHGHFIVNGRRVDIPSYSVKPGDLIQPREKSRELATIKENTTEFWTLRPGWLEMDMAAATAKMTEVPQPDAVPFAVDVQLVVEFYAKKM